MLKLLSHLSHYLFLIVFVLTLPRYIILLINTAYNYRTRQYQLNIQIVFYYQLNGIMAYLILLYIMDLFSLIIFISCLYVFFILHSTNITL